jgi:hypothetical protein
VIPLATDNDDHMYVPHFRGVIFDSRDTPTFDALRLGSRNPLIYNILTNGGAPKETYMLGAAHSKNSTHAMITALLTSDLNPDFRIFGNWTGLIILAGDISVT